ncbi:hypothetical protein ACFL0P_07165 [Candidatus Omnitrophota bacterium]
MSKTFKIVLALLVIVSIVSAAFAVLAFIGKERESIKRLMLEDKLATTLKDKKQLEKELVLNEVAKEESETKIKVMEEEAKALLSQIETEKNKAESAILDLDVQKKEITKIKSDLENEKKEKLSISKKLENLQVDYVRAKEDISRLGKEKANLKKRLSSLKEKSVDLDTIVVNPLEYGAVAPVKIESQKELLKGTVLVVNKDYNFIVTDLGQDDDVSKGALFEIRNNKGLLGKVEIDKVYDTMSSASVLPGAEINNIKKGDLVIESH